MARPPPAGGSLSSRFLATQPMQGDLSTRRNSGLRDKLIAKHDVVLTYALRAFVDDGVLNPVAATAMPRQRLLRRRPDRASAEASRSLCTRRSAPRHRL
jgi:hypothetical protein